MIAILAAINFAFVGIWIAAIADTGNLTYGVMILINAIAGFFILSVD